VKVVVSHPKKRTYRVTGLARLSARQDKFDHEELGKVSCCSNFPIFIDQPNESTTRALLGVANFVCLSVVS
jgi:hypothetical protein